ncbi:MAG: hypothetical protein ABL982_13500 [Vicinamibacterales bacterium]
MNRAAIEWARDQVLTGNPEAHPPDAVWFLLRLYVAGDGLVRNSVELGLTRGLSLAGSASDPCSRMQWLRLLAEAATLSDDEQLRSTVTRELPDGVDALESLVRRSYEPGDGLLGLDGAAHVRCASALLAAFDLSGRLPYAMLAEELLRHARRHWFHHESGAFEVDFGANCVALRVLCRIALLHADPDYLAAAVIAPESDAEGDARALATTLEARSGEHPDEAGRFGAALLDWFALTGVLH